jgi:hypothetical protein
MPTGIHPLFPIYRGLCLPVVPFIIPQVATFTLTPTAFIGILTWTSSKSRSSATDQGITFTMDSESTINSTLAPPTLAFARVQGIFYLRSGHGCQEFYGFCSNIGCTALFWRSVLRFCNYFLCVGWQNSCELCKSCWNFQMVWLLQ